MLVLLVTLFGCVDADAPVKPGDDETFVLEIPKGSTASGLGPRLLAQGLVPGELQWKIFLRQTDGSCLKAGRFEVRRSMSLNTLLQTLCGTPLPEDVPFTVLEGWRIRDIDKALAAQGWVAPGTYADLAARKAVEAPFGIASPSLEGYLYPETYRVTPDEGVAADLIARQLETFKARFLDTHTLPPSRTLHEVVVMASMLEREEPKPENRALVAGILWKRIDKGYALGVDATSRYALEDWNDRKAFLQRLRDPSDPYNTRENKGLPPTAIGNPTVSSLEAAIAPQGSEFWYYLHDADRNLHPARNAAEHEANRAKYNVY